jgi:hypothetical protein
MTLAKELPADKWQEFIKLVKNREASISIGASTARGMGEGTVEAARKFLRSLDLSSFVTESEDAFLQHLDAKTEELQMKLPNRNRSWGAARKFLNIFLRGAFYNRFLCDHFGLYVLEDFLEIPLDESVATGLRSEHGGESLPRWNTIIRLGRQESAAYQAFARQVSRRKKCARVHLDLQYFRRDESEG